MNTHIYAARRERLRKKMHDKGLAALLVSHAANRFYLSGFELHDPQCNESAGFLLITASGRDHLLTDPRYLDAARRLWPERDIFIYSGKKLDVIRTFLAASADGAIGIEAQSMCVEIYQKLSDGLQLEPVKGLVEKLRLIKDAQEMDALARSCKVNHQVMERCPQLLTPGRTEAQVAWEIEKSFRGLGASGMSFDSIVAVGPNAALPHAIPGQEIIPEQGLVLVDTGGRVEQYCSDQTRTFWTGDEPSDRFRRTVEQVQEAQQAAIDSIRPGVKIADAYAAARKVFERYGVAEQFTHALGHGIGLETHESPSLSPTAEGEFKAGMVVTVEPGLYDAAWGGVRWEYMAVVEEDGCRVL